MQMRHLFVIAAIAVGTAACKPDAVDADAVGSAEAGSEAADDANAVGGNDRNPAPSGAAAPGGAFARKPGFQLPVPVSSVPVGAGSVPQSRPADPAGIRTALLEGMEASGANIQVQVAPTGIVSLSGEVGTVAELQRAHYLARAQPGVVEVDYRQLRVRQR